MVEKGAGIYIEDKDINEKTLFDAVNSAIENLDEMQKNSLALAKLDGVEKIVEQLRSL
jgi:UDP-N-acetylglucosamine:LPS N-acetylglucosamine transferase